MNYVILEFKELQKQSRLIFHSVNQGKGIKDFLNRIELVKNKKYATIKICLTDLKIDLNYDRDNLFMYTHSVLCSSGD